MTQKYPNSIDDMDDQVLDLIYAQRNKPMTTDTEKLEAAVLINDGKHCQIEIQGCVYNVASEHADLIVNSVNAHLRQQQAVTGDRAGVPITGDTSDGYHTFNALYEHRHALFSAIARVYPQLAWKSMRHDDETMFDGWFIAGISTPDGHATYHLPERLFANFPGAELDRAPEWGGHTSDDVIKRIGSLSAAPQVAPAPASVEATERVIQAAIGVVNADSYKHPVLSRDDAVKEGVAELHDAVSKYQATRQGMIASTPPQATDEV